MKKVAILMGSDSDLPIVEKGIKVLSDYGERILIKSPNRGCNELRQAIADYLFRSNGIKVEPDRIIIGSGAEYLYTLIVQLLGKNRIFGLENPSYDKIHRVYDLYVP